MRRLITVILSLVLLSTFSFAEEPSEKERGKSGEKPEKSEKPEKPEKPGRPDDHDDKGPIQAGWAIVTPMTVTTGASSSSLVVFATFGFKRGEETLQAGLLPSDLSKESLMFVSASGKLSRNMGFAIVNPNNTAASVEMTLHDEEGQVIGASKTITVASGNQKAEFVTSVFADRPEVPKDFTGTVSLKSNMAVSMTGLRFRGANFSTIPITNLSQAFPAPERGAGVGGPNAVIVPQFATGGGWATELVLVNTGGQKITVRVDLFKPDGTPMTVRLNGEEKNSFTDIVIPGGGVFELSPKDSDGHSRF
jgi:hypothetical protein